MSQEAGQGEAYVFLKVKDSLLIERNKRDTNHFRGPLVGEVPPDLTNLSALLPFLVLRETKGKPTM